MDLKRLKVDQPAFRVQNGRKYDILDESGAKLAEITLGRHSGPTWIRNDRKYTGRQFRSEWIQMKRPRMKTTPRSRIKHHYNCGLRLQRTGLTTYKAPNEPIFMSYFKSTHSMPLCH